MLKPIHFNPLADNLFAPVVPILKEVHSIEDDLTVPNNWSMACMAGALAYAMVATDSPATTVDKCKNALLMRLGLSGKQSLNAEQEQIMGFVIGLFGSLESALEADEATVINVEVKS